MPEMAGSTQLTRKKCTFRRRVAHTRTLGVDRPRPFLQFVKVLGLRKGHTHLHPSDHESPWASLFHSHPPSSFFIPRITHDSITTFFYSSRKDSAISLASIIYHPPHCCTFIIPPLALNCGHLICMDTCPPWPPFSVAVRCPCQLFLALRLGLRVESHLAFGRCVFSPAFALVPISLPLPRGPFVHPPRSFPHSLVIRIFLVPPNRLPDGQFLILWAKGSCSRYTEFNVRTDSLD